MTRDEAIAILREEREGICTDMQCAMTMYRDYSGVDKCNRNCEEREAYDMAIEALKEKAMTKDEAIQELAEWIKQMKDHGVPNYSAKYKALDIAMEALQAEPKTKCVAQIEVDTEEAVRRIKEEYDIADRWIPVSERLPSEIGWYLITVQGLNRFTDMVYYYGNSEWDEVSSKQKVIAWMPLPEPYREDGE